ncbi:MAG: hypothetical protein KDA36_01265 [Planctomycetaceae bacterium]|nr:hypothetical protein [Planctomycetaceae bacterium]
MVMGVVIVDHGSRLEESNRLLEEVVRTFAAGNGEKFPVVEAAHMELAEPTIGQAYDACVARGATEIIVSPFFLGPGKHWTRDIPELIAEAAARHPETTWKLAAPLGNHPLLQHLLLQRIREALGEV